MFTRPGQKGSVVDSLVEKVGRAFGLSHVIANTKNEIFFDWLWRGETRESEKVE
jgi:hypothetical protein